MGWYTQYFSTIFKGPSITRWKQRIEVGRLEKRARMIEEVYKKFQEEVLRNHQVTKFLRRLSTLEKDAEKIGHDLSLVIFNGLIQDINEEREIDGILEILEKHFPKLARDVKIRFVKYIEEDASKLKQKEEGDRREYFELEAVLKEAGDLRHDRRQMMEMLRTALKKRESLRKMTERVSWRLSVAGAKKEIKRTKFDKKGLESILGALASAPQNQKERLLAEMEAEMKDIAKAIAEAFYESYLVKERAILFFMRLVFILQTIIDECRIAVEKHYLPKQPVQEIEEKIENAVAKIAHKFHDVIQQGYRIDVKKLGAEERRILALRRAA